MKYLIFFLLIIFPFGQLIRINLGNSIVLHPNDVAVFIFLLLTLRKISGTLVRPLILFAVAVVLSFLLNSLNFKPLELLVASLYPLRFFAYAGLFFVFKDLAPNLKLYTRRWLQMVIIIVAITGLLQYIFLPNVAFLSAFDWDDHYFRLIGTFFDPGFTGAILSLGLLIAPLPAQILIYLAMALTYSRASYLMYLVMFAAIAWFKKSPKIFIIASLILALTIFVLPRNPGEGSNLSRENSTWSRIHNWQQTISVWQTAPIFGVGFNTYRYVVNVDPQSHSGGADSSIFLVLATTGIVGLTAYLYLLYAMLKFGRRNSIFVACFLGVIIHSFFNNTLFYPWVMEFIWLLLALSTSRSQPGPKQQL